MHQIDIYVPAMGEGIVEATITKWLKKEGDLVNEDETIVEIATDKVDSEIPAPKAGILAKILLPEGSVPKVGQIIAFIQTENQVEQNPDLSIIKETITFKPETQIAQKQESDFDRTNETKFLSPLVRSFVAKEKIPLSELKKIKGTGLNGRITKNDIILIDSKKNQQNEKTEIEVLKPVINQNIIVSGNHDQIFPVNEQIIEMDRVRKLIASHMLNSVKTAPHVCSFIEADLTNVVNWRDKNKLHFEEREKEKLSFTPVFFYAVAQALRKFPMINVSVSETNIIVKNNINLGMAVALPNGNLIVPVIKNADQKNLLGLTKTINDLAKRARINKLNPDEIQGGTFTITNLGSFGTLAGTPIINQPESAILGIGAIRKMPAVIETPFGDLIGIRHKLILSLSYDHRVIDGYLAGQFLNKIVELLEKFEPNQTI